MVITGAERTSDGSVSPAPGRSRVPLLIAVSLVIIAVGALLLAVVRDGGISAALGGQHAVFRSGHIVFRSLEAGPDHGRIGYVPADAATQPPTLARPRCLRVAAAAELAVCLRTGRNPLQPYEVVQLDRDLAEVNDESLNGVPSRVRVAPDGRHFASTVFVSGHNYISLGFSTETVIYQADGRPIGNLEEFTFLINGREDTSSDRNVWGVTFAADSRLFFATVAASGRTYLARGDLGARTLTALRENAECPSLSPDERTVVYKKRVSSTADQAWRFHALDLQTGQERPLGEHRSVDDQVAWLNNFEVLYAVPTVTDGRTTADIWAAPINGGAPRLLIRNADSPTVVGTNR